MQRIIFVFFYLGINLFRLTPFFMVNFLSRIIYFVLYYLVGYRKKVVFQNLKSCFPAKDDIEIKKLVKAFYKENLSAIFAEGLKGFTMSSKQFTSRYKLVNPEILDNFYNKGQDIIALASHFTNWEWGIQAVNQQVEHQAAALYKPMSNLVIEKYAKGLREKYGMQLVPITETRAFFEKKKEKPVMYIMAADQYPGGLVNKAIWVDFLGRETACLHGPESYARFNNLPVVFFDVNRVKRGFYELEIKIVAENVSSRPAGDITKEYMRLLEEAIKKNPQNWLWSHKRWKKTRKEVEAQMA